MAMIVAMAEIESYIVTGDSHAINTSASGKFDSDYARMSLEHQGDYVVNGDYVGRTFTGATSIWMTCRASFESLHSSLDDAIIHLDDSVSGNTTLRFKSLNSRYFLEWWNGSSYTAGLKDFRPVINTVYKIDIHCLIHDTTGRFAFYIDDILIEEFIGDTNLYASSQVDNLKLTGPQASHSAARAVHFSEVVVADEPTIGWRVATIVPDADGNTVGEWTGGWADVDEITASDADNLNSTASNDTETMGATNLSTPAAALVEYVAMVLQARVKDDAGSSPLQFQFIVRTGGTDYFSSTIALGSSYSHEENVWAVNPGTTNPWTASEIDAIELGVESIA